MTLHDFSLYFLAGLGFLWLMLPMLKLLLELAAKLGHWWNSKK